MRIRAIWFAILPARLAFRLRVPAAPQALLGRVVIKHALGTRDTLAAQCEAITLASRYARLFDLFGRQRMAKHLTSSAV